MSLSALVGGAAVVWTGGRIRRGRERRIRLEASERRERFLADASRALVETLEPDALVRRIARLAVSVLADVCIIDLVYEPKDVRRAAVSIADPNLQRIARELERFRPDPETRRHPVFEAMRTGRIETVDARSREVRRDIAPYPEHRAIVEKFDPCVVMLVPLTARGHALGCIQLARVDRSSFDTDEIALAGELGTRVALALDNARLYRDAERQALGERALRQATEAVAASFTVAEVIRRIAESAVMATDADGAAVERIDTDRADLVVVAVAGDLVHEVGARIPLAGSLAERVLERQETEVVPRIAEADRPFVGFTAPDPEGSALVVPLLNGGEPIGALVLLRRSERGRFRPDEIQRARTFADLAALAFRKIHLLEDSERKRRELVEVMESRANQMRGFSHDVKNPLGAADGQLQLLEAIHGERLAPDQREMVKRARRSLDSALALIDDLLGIARNEVDRVEVDWVAVDVRAAVAEMAEDFRAQAESKGLGMSVDVPAELPLIRSDAARIRQILGNLLSNAVKYTDSGRLSVRVVTAAGEGTPGPGEWVRVDVADTGKGIPAAQMRNLFREFERGDPGSAEGAGVGLSISRRIADSLGGSIEVDSRQGRGSTFTLWLPLERPAPMAEHASRVDQG